MGEDIILVVHGGDEAANLLSLYLGSASVSIQFYVLAANSGWNDTTVWGSMDWEGAEG